MKAAAEIRETVKDAGEKASKKARAAKQRTKAEASDHMKGLVRCRGSREARRDCVRRGSRAHSFESAKRARRRASGRRRRRKSWGSPAGASVKIVAPKIAPVTLAQGKRIDADGQLAGTPSMVFDAVAIILSDKAACQLSGEGAAIDFFRNAFGHLKAIGVDAGGRGLLEHAGVPADAAGVVDVRDSRSFMTLAKTRQWDREASVRSLA